MPLVFKYTFTTYPFAPDCTRRSKILGFATCPASCFLLTFIIGMILCPGAIDSGVGAVIILAAAILARFPGKAIWEKLSKNISRQAMPSLLALEQTDPEAFRVYAELFKEELEDYRRSCSYQAPSGASQQTYSQQFRQEYQPQNQYQHQNAHHPQFHQASHRNDTQAANRVVPHNTSASNMRAIPAPATAKVYCNKCGVKLKPGAAFCHHCGNKL